MKPARLRPLAAGAAVLLLLPLAGAPRRAHAAQAPDAAGRWSLQRAPVTGTAQLSLEIVRPNGRRASHSHAVALAQLAGLAPSDLERDTADVAFRMDREAGAIVARGTLAHGTGRGTFELFLEPAFADELERRGVGRPDRDQQIQLVLADAGVALLDDLRAAGCPAPGVAAFVRGVQHGVSREYVAELLAAGCRPASLDEWVKAHDHGIDARFIRELEPYVPRDLSLDRWTRLRDHGVDGAYLEALARVGYRGLRLDDAIEAHDHGVDAAYLAALHDAGYASLPLHEAIRARDRGVDAAFALSARRRLGRTPSIDELIRMRDAGESIE